MLISYFIYKLVRWFLPKLHCNWLLKITENNDSRNWDTADLIHQVPSSFLGFLITEYIVVWLGVGLIGGGHHVFSMRAFFGTWLYVLSGFESAMGCIGVLGIFICTILGLYKDFPPTRLKILASIFLFSVLTGYGIRFS